jgi:(R,R)-butanediol dehydrogenase/meso-butanediol dehydrogenase/diacetyl reductase
MGHEFCGRIKYAPKGSAYREGQGVVVDPRLLCRSCTPCVTGVDHCCLKIGFLGYSGRGGGFSEVVAVDSNMLHAIPDNVSIADVAIAEPLATAHHAVKAAGIHNLGNANTLVIGGGPVGLMLILALRAQGAKHIAVSEPTSARREHLKDMADLVINPLEQDVSAVCKESTQGLGPDVVFDCAGVPQSIETAFKAIRIGGIHVNVAVWEKPVCLRTTLMLDQHSQMQMILPVWDFLFKDITIRPALAYNDQDFSEVMQMLSEGMLDVIRT